MITFAVVLFFSAPAITVSAFRLGLPFSVYHTHSGQYLPANWTLIVHFPRTWRYETNRDSDIRRYCRGLVDGESERAAIEKHLLAPILYCGRPEALETFPCDQHQCKAGNLT